MILPVVIAVGLVLLAAVVWLIVPGAFNTGLAIAISLGLFVFLLYWTRREAGKRRVTAVMLAIPALVGLGYGVSNGRLSPIIFGVGLTILLLIAHRALSIPISYRFAMRRFTAGDDERALELLDKTIAVRPDFWEAYQLKATIFLSQLDFPRAERAAREAIAVNPKADAAYNTLGQIYLAQAQFADAKEAYNHAAAQNPDYALHWYHLGLCQYRLGEYTAATESLTAATKRAPHILEYELLTHYYLWQCLKESGHDTAATDVYIRMLKFADGLPRLQDQIAHQPDTPYLPLFQADLANLAQNIQVGG
jgi:tetratricopeptide (TPR) repeat protein